MTLDRIELIGLKARGFHGVLAEERRDGQDFVVDVTLGIDLSAAARTDDLLATVDYGEIAESVVEIIGGQAVDLIETLAGRIVDSCLKREKVQWARVKVHKPQAPIAATFTDVVVTIERSKS